MELARLHIAGTISGMSVRTSPAAIPGHGARIAMTLLRQALGFRDAPGEAIEQLAIAGRVRSLDKGEALVRKGELFDNLCVIVEGALEAAVILEDGRRYLVSFLNQGDVAGLMSLMDQMPHHADLIAREAGTQVLLIPGADFRRLRDPFPSLARAIELQLSFRTRLLYERLIADASMALEVRLARQLHLMATLSGRAQSETEHPTFRMSQADMGDFLSVSRPRANFAAQQLKKEGLIELKYSSVTIIDASGLARRAGF